MKSLAIFGGTFDPIHFGHLKTSLQIQDCFHFDAFHFLPCNRPVLKAPAFATNEQRIRMIELALEGLNGFSLDCREINSPSPSYMVTSLTSIRKEHPLASITLIMGYDAFVSLPKWHQWEQLLDLAHLLVIQRVEFANQSLPAVLQKLLKDHQTQSKSKLLQQKAGCIFLFDAGQVDVSSTNIRKAVQEAKSFENKLPKTVYDYIKINKLYQ